MQYEEDGGKKTVHLIISRFLSLSLCLCIFFVEKEKVGKWTEMEGGGSEAIRYLCGPKLQLVPASRAHSSILNAISRASRKIIHLFNAT